MAQDKEIPQWREEQVTSIYFLLPLFLFLLLFPFLPGIIELFRPKDSEPLFVRMDYSKDPRYFGSAFKDLLRDSLREDSSVGTKNIKLSKDEKIDVVLSANISQGRRVLGILYASGKISSEENAVFDKEVYAVGGAVIGARNIVRAIASDSDIKLSEEVKVIRWLDAEEGITADKHCDLGISASCAAELKLDTGNAFKRLWGKPVATRGLSSGSVRPDDSLAGHLKSTMKNDKDIEVIPPSTTVGKTLVVKKNLEIRENCVLMQSVKVYGDLIVGENTKIYGNVFSEGNIDIKEGCEISGNIFSQGAIRLRDRVRVGNSGSIKSVIGKKEVLIGRDVRIFRYVMTEGRGLTI